LQGSVEDASTWIHLSKVPFLIDLTLRSTLPIGHAVAPSRNHSTKCKSCCQASTFIGGTRRPARDCSPQRHGLLSLRSCFDTNRRLRRRAQYLATNSLSFYMRRFRCLLPKPTSGLQPRPPPLPLPNPSEAQAQARRRLQMARG